MKQYLSNVNLKKLFNPTRTDCLIPLSCLESMKILYNYIGTFYIFLPLYALSIPHSNDHEYNINDYLKPGVFTLTVGSL